VKDQDEDTPPVGAECHICLEGGEKLTALGCACRGAAGYAHVDCLIKYAASVRDETRKFAVWDVCLTCNKEYTGDMHQALACAWYEKKRFLKPDDEERLIASHNLGTALYNSKKYKQCEELRSSIYWRFYYSRVHGPDSPNTLRSGSSLANVLDSLERSDEAAKLHREMLTRKRRVFGPLHISTLNSAMNLGLTLNVLGQHEDAVKLLRKTLKTKRSVLGPKDQRTLQAANALARSLNGMGRQKEAELLLRNTLNLQKTILGSHHPDTLSSSDLLENLQLPEKIKDLVSSMQEQT